MGFSFLTNILGKWIGGMFQTKQESMKVWQEGIVGMFLALRQTGLTDVGIAQLACQIWINDAKSEHFLVRSWRPIVALAFTTLVIAIICGFTPPILQLTTIPPALEKVFELVTLLIGGGMGLRTIDKITTAVSKTKMADKLMNGLADSAKKNLGIDLDRRDDAY